MKKNHEPRGAGVAATPLTPVALERLERERAAVQATESELEQIEVALAAAECDPAALDRAIAARRAIVERLEVLRERVVQAEVALEQAQAHDYSVRCDVIALEVEGLEEEMARADREFEARIGEFLRVVESHCAAQAARAEAAARLDDEAGNRGPPGGRSPWARPGMADAAESFTHVRVAAVRLQQDEARRAPAERKCVNHGGRPAVPGRHVCAECR